MALPWFKTSLLAANRVIRRREITLGSPRHESTLRRKARGVTVNLRECQHDRDRTACPSQRDLRTYSQSLCWSAALSSRPGNRDSEKAVSFACELSPLRGGPNGCAGCCNNGPIPLEAESAPSTLIHPVSTLSQNGGPKCRYAHSHTDFAFLLSLAPPPLSLLQSPHPPPEPDFL